jgi:hypothetical protein
MSNKRPNKEAMARVPETLRRVKKMVFVDHGMMMVN